MSEPVFRSAADDDEDEESPPADSGAARRTPDLEQDFFRRDKNGMVKLRINLTAEEATLVEEAAATGGTPVMFYVHRVLMDRAKFHLSRHRRNHVRH